MQTFLPYPSFKNSAKCLDSRRLGKQRVECLQLLQALEKGDYICSCCRKSVFIVNNGDDQSACCKAQIIKTPWYNHPACKMWRGYKNALAYYGIEICKEWINRGYKDTCLEKIKKYVNLLCAPSPHWVGSISLHSSHRAALLFKDFEHYKQFDWKEKPEIKYFWPN